MIRQRLISCRHAVSQGIRAWPVVSAGFANANSDVMQRYVRTDMHNSLNQSFVSSYILRGYSTDVPPSAREVGSVAGPQKSQAEYDSDDQNNKEIMRSLWDPSVMNRGSG